MTQTRRPRALLGVGIALNMILACSSEPLHPQMSREQIVSLEAWQMDTTQDPVLTSNAADIGALVEVLRTGEPTRDHKCSNTHMIVLRLATGDKITLGFLSGHTPGFYEYRLYDGDTYRVFRVEEEPLLDALDALGIGTDIEK